MLALLLLASLAPAQDSPFGRKRAGGDEEDAPAKPRPGRQAPESPNKPARTKEAVRSALSYIASRQKKDGSWDAPLGGETGAVVVASFCGLALMASGSTPTQGPFAQQVRLAVDFVQAGIFKPPTMRDPKWDQTNWQVAVGGLFLAEAYAKTRTESLKVVLQRVADELSKRQEPSGGWGHSNSGPNALNYVELSVMSTWALGTLGALKKEKLRVDAGRIAAGLRFLEECCAPGRGAVGYSPRPGQKGVGETGRNGGSLWVFGLHGQTGHPLYPRMAEWWRANLQGAVNGHGSIAMGCLGSALGGLQLGRGDWDRFVAQVFPKLLEHQEADGGFRTIRGTGAGAVGGDNSAGPFYSTALYALVLQMDLGNLAYIGEKF